MHARTTYLPFIVTLFVYFYYTNTCNIYIHSFIHVHTSVTYVTYDQSSKYTHAITCARFTANEEEQTILEQIRASQEPQEVREHCGGGLVAGTEAGAIGLSG